MPSCDECGQWPQPSLAVDAVVIRGDEVLLITRGREPWKGMLAFPGGFVDKGEDPEESVIRELKEECGIDGKVVKILCVRGKPTRDPRGMLCHWRILCLQMESQQPEMMLQVQVGTKFLKSRRWQVTTFQSLMRSINSDLVFGQSGSFNASVRCSPASHAASIDSSASFAMNSGYPSPTSLSRKPLLALLTSSAGTPSKTASLAKVTD